MQVQGLDQNLKGRSYWDRLGSWRDVIEMESFKMILMSLQWFFFSNKGE